MASSTGSTSTTTGGETTASWLKRFKAQKKQQGGCQERLPADLSAAGPSPTPGSNKAHRPEITPQLAGDSGDALMEETPTTQTHRVTVNVEDVFDAEGRIREDAEPDDAVLEAAREAQARRMASRLHRRRMGLSATLDDSETVEQRLGSDVLHVSLGDEDQGDDSQRRHGRSGQLRQRLASGDGGGETTRQQNDFAETESSLRPATSVESRRAAGGVTRDPAARRREIEERARLLQQQRDKLRLAAQSARAKHEAVEVPVGATTDLVSLDSVVGTPEDAVGAAELPNAQLEIARSAVKPELTAAAQGSWTAASAASPKPEEHNVTQPPETPIPQPLEPTTNTPAAAAERPAATTGDGEAKEHTKTRKRVNVMALARQLVAEKVKPVDEHGATDRVAGAMARRDSRGKLLTSSEAFKQVSKQFDDGR